MHRLLAAMACSLLLLLPSSYLYGQQEAKVWYLGNGEGLDFSNAPLNPINAGAPATTLNNGDVFATVTDASGRVLFFSEGHSVLRWQGNSVLVMDNGGGLLGTGERQVIIRKPGSLSQYMIFYVGTRGTGVKEVMYSIVDLNGNGGAGRVVEKNQTLYEGLHGSFTISAGCAGDRYWLVGEADRDVTQGTDRLYAFRIDSAGISERVVSIPVNMTKAAALRFSPDGTKLFFNVTGLGSEGSLLAVFNRETGNVAPLQLIGTGYGYAEFSSNGKILYVNYPGSSETNLVQYDISKDIAVATNIAKLTSKSTRLQIGIDERMYVLLPDDNMPTRLGVIRNPNAPGLACDFQILSPFAPTIGMKLALPEFSTNAFYKSPYSPPDAGGDRDACVGDLISIGSSNSTDQRYRWFPPDHLVNPLADQTEFRFDQDIQEELKLVYVLKGLGDECVAPDTMEVHVHPRLVAEISGAHSVCPGVTSVTYATPPKDGQTYEWSVEGGAISGSNREANVRVDWGATNPDASVTLRINNEFNCASNPGTLPVRVNVILDTQTPAGPLEVCENLSDNHRYQVDSTSGSLYQWTIQGGTLDQGQGSASVNVSWTQMAPHRIWVTESSTTKDTVCYGSSDTVNVQLFRDSLMVNLQTVSVSRDDDSAAIISGVLVNNHSGIGPIILSRRKQDDESWDAIHEWTPNEQSILSFQDFALETDSLIYEYQITTQNSCQLNVSSDTHTTIRLKAEANEANDEITLDWNGYSGWPNGVGTYEVWRKLDNATDFTFVASTLDRSMKLNDADLSFTHSFRIRALAKNDTLRIWSNQAEATFKHELNLPNVFTPNDDSFNDQFDFPYLQLYPSNELLVYNRNGREVFRQLNYRGTWTGDGLVAGVYYYVFRDSNSGKAYRGWVHILR